MQILGIYGPSNQSDNKKEKDEFTKGFQEKLKQVGLSKDQVYEKYFKSFDIKKEELEKNDLEKDFSLVIANELLLNKVAVNKIINAIEDFYKLDTLVEEINTYDFLNDDEKRISRKFLRREVEGELLITCPEQLLQPVSIFPALYEIKAISNDLTDDDLVESFKEYMDLIKHLKNLIKELKMKGEVGLVLES